MVTTVIESPEEGRLASVMAALRESARRTKRYFIGSAIFYLVLITVFTVLVVIIDEPRARGADTGILILVSLGFLSLWISALRGLRWAKFGVADFLNIFRFPLFDRLEELEDAGRWEGEQERLRGALELLSSQASAEKEHRAWFNRALSFSVITAIDLAIWLAWDNLLMAVVNQVIAMIVSTVHISLGPRSSMKALEELGRRP